jgi:hypothetical protein
VGDISVHSGRDLEVVRVNQGHNVDRGQELLSALHGSISAWKKAHIVVDHNHDVGRRAEEKYSYWKMSSRVKTALSTVINHKAAK